MIKIGICSTSNINHRFILGASYVKDADVCAISSRNYDKAKAFCQKYPNIQPYQDYEQMLNGDIDAVYISSPNFMHYEHVIMALKHHKHVICEKPMMLNKEEIIKAFELARNNGLVLMEASKGNFLPTTLKALEFIKTNDLKINSIYTTYGKNNLEVFKTGWHSDIRLGGGASYDIGVYPISFIQMIANDQIKKIDTDKQMLGNIDIHTKADMIFNNGIKAKMIASVSLDLYNIAIIETDKAIIRIENYWKSNRMTINDKEYYFEHHNAEFQYEIASFIETIKNHDVENNIMDEKRSLAIMNILQMIID